MGAPWNGPLEKIDDYRFRIPKAYKQGMRVDGIIYADEKMLGEIRQDQAAEQVANVAFLPGIVRNSFAMPDIHWGYGFCLTKDTKILTDFGFYKSIKDFDKDWFKQNLRCVDLHSQKAAETSILRFIRLEPKEVFRIVTKEGYEIKATEDHPFFTPLGMQSIGELSPGEKVAIFPFQGVAYEEPSNEIIASEEDIRGTLLKLGRQPNTPGFEIVLQKLKERNLLPLTYSHSKLPYILKIMGFVFGDGSMNFIGKRGDGILHFSGKPQDLEEVRRDLRKVGYTPSPLHFQKVNNSRGNNKYYDCCSFLVNASSLVVLLEALGVPRGSKVDQAYRIPKWIFKAPLWQKRLFLASLFGCELRIPHRRLHRRGYFNAPVFPMAKREKLIKNGKDFLGDIAKLLEEFGVRVLYIEKRKKHINTKGKISWALELLISPKTENLFNLWSKIGFEYNSERAFMANVCVHYLKLKLKILKEKEEVINVTIPKLLKERLSYQKIALQLAGNPLTKRFIIDVCWKLNKGRRISPRIPFNFPDFSDYLKEVTEGLGMSGMVWDEIKEIEKIPYQDFVYDFTVSHSDHNFIANNFVVSNCIGGVAATDPKEGGVISPGGVGYDINCLSPDTEILMPHGYVRKITDLERDFQKTDLVCMDLNENYFTRTKISQYIKIRPRNRVFKLKTYSGREIIATEDHPFWTPLGMKPICNLKEGDLVGVYPFQGVFYEEPSSKVIINEDDIKDVLLKLGKDSRGHGLEQIIKWLKKFDLIPLRYNSWQLPYLLKIMGYIFGDGTVYFNKKRGKGITWFYGKEEDLEKIGEDIRTIGFGCSKVYSRNRQHKIKTNYAFYEFSNIETSCKVDSSSFAALLVALGIPLGNKAAQNYDIPTWLWQAPIWQKRLFLAGFLGAELSSPKTLTGHDYNFYAPVISMNKKEDFVENGVIFLNGLTKLLREFGVKAKKISQRVEYINAKNDISYRLRLMLANTPESMINVYSKVGFEYNARRSFLANVATQYLKFKENVCRERREIALRARELHRATDKGARHIYQEIGTEAVNLRFIERSIYGGRKTSPRVPFNTMGFIEFLEAHTRGLGNSGAVWDEIVSKEEFEYSDYVYDFTVEHSHHNFIANNFVVSNCGVRLVRTNLFIDEVKTKIKELTTSLFHAIPAGVGSTGDIRISVQEERTLLVKGSRWAVEKGYGIKEDLECTEEGGCIEGANPEDVSERAYERGKKQSGTLGSGNHFLEIQEVERIYDRTLADRFCLREGQITLMIHSGSRGLGYQVCDDYLEIMGKAVRKYNISLPDRQLACAPIESPEARAYISAMRCAANYAWANRQCLMHLTRLVFERVFNKSWESLGMFLIYDVAHNIAKFEKYNIDGREKTLCVHRKGATRAFGPAHPELPARYKDTGQPVVIPGDMGRNSFLLVGTAKAEETFYSTCHGAGRLMSRTQAIKFCSGRNISRELEEKGVVVMASSRGTLAEEIPEAYKDVNDVVKVVAGAGISKIVCRMRPLGVIKG